MAIKKPFSLEETLTVLRADGLLSGKNLAKVMKNRSLVSIQCFWKKFPQKAEAAFNGLPYEMVEPYCPECPYLYTEVGHGVRLCLWVDIHNNIDKFPNKVRSLIEIMSEFQIWLHDATEDNVRSKVCQNLLSYLKDKPRKKRV